MSRIAEQLAEYEARVRMNPEDHGARWQILVCRYGLVTLTGEDGQPRDFLSRLGTPSIFEDRDAAYLMQHTDGEEKQEYLRRINAVASAQDEAAKVAEAVRPYTVYLEAGPGPEAAQLGEDIYQQLTAEGIRTFYEPHGGMARDPEAYRLHALATAKLYIPVAAEPGDYDRMAPQWMRCLSLAEEDPRRHILPVFRGLSPKDFPAPIARLQAIDAGRIGAVSAYLMPRVRELAGKNRTIVVRKEDGGSLNLTNVFTRLGFMLEDGEFDEVQGRLQTIAREYGEDYPQLRELRLLCAYQAANLEELVTRHDSGIFRHADYQYLLENGDDETKEALANLGNRAEELRRQEQEAELVEAVRQAHVAGDYREVLRLAKQIHDMPDFSRYEDIEGFFSIAQERVRKQNLLEAYRKELGDSYKFYLKRLRERFPDKHEIWTEHSRQKPKDDEDEEYDGGSSSVFTKGLIRVIAFIAAMVIIRLFPDLGMVMFGIIIYYVVAGYLREHRMFGFIGSLLLTFLKLFVLPGILLIGIGLGVNALFHVGLVKLLYGDRNLNDFMILCLPILLGGLLQGLTMMFFNRKAHKNKVSGEKAYRELLEWIPEFEAEEYRKLADKYKEAVGEDWIEPVSLLRR